MRVTSTGINCENKNNENKENGIYKNGKAFLYYRSLAIFRLPSYIIHLTL